MTVYIDDLYAPYRKSFVCHMIADTEEELLAMAATIQVNPVFQYDAGTSDSHFDVNRAQRALALQNGAREISKRELARICRERRDNGGYG
jgi:hypothetical protein